MDISRRREETLAGDSHRGWIGETSGLADASWGTWHATQKWVRVGCGAIGAPLAPVAWHSWQIAFRSSTS